MREILFKITKDKEHIEPRTRQWAGMQHEDKATEVIFDLSSLNITNALYRIDFNSSAAGYHPSENLTSEKNKIKLSIPNYITRYGGEVQVTAVITLLDDNKKETGVVLSYPVMVYFTDVSRDAEGSEEVEKNISIVEFYVEEAKLSAASALKSELAAEEAQQQTEEARRALEEGTTFVFMGGDSESEAEVDLVIDSELSDLSENPIANKAVAKAIEELSVDYIVEQGERDMPSAIAPNNVATWVYRKWHSGVIECWLANTPLDFSSGSFTDSTGMVNSNGSKLILKWVDISLPFQDKSGKLPMVTGSSTWKTTEWFDCQTQNASLIRLRWLGVPSSFTAEPTNQLKVSLYVKGRWK